MAPPRKYPAGEGPWVVLGISEKTWRRRDLESRLTPDQLDARRAHTRATLKAAAERRRVGATPEQLAARRALTKAASARYKAKLRSSRATNANPVPGVNVYDGWHGKGAALKGRKRPPRGLDTQARVGWSMAHAARRALALRAALEDGSWREWMTRDPEFGQREDRDCQLTVHETDHDATLVAEQVA